MIDAPSFVRELVTVPGAGTYTQADLESQMRRRLAGVSGGEALLPLLPHVYRRARIRQRHFEVPPEEADADLRGALFSLGRRALQRLLDTAGLSPADLDGLITVTGGQAGEGLAARFAEAFHLPAGGFHYDVVSLDTSGPAQACFLAQTLLRRGACATVCVLAVDLPASASVRPPAERLPSLATLMTWSVVSDGAAALVLSRHAGPTPRLAYQRCTLATRAWPHPTQADGAGDAEALQDRILAELRAWRTKGDGTAPIFLCPGGTGLVRVIAERHPELEASTALARRLVESHGVLAGTSALWILDDVLSGDRLHPLFRLFALGPGVAVTVLSIEGVTGDDPA